MQYTGFSNNTPYEPVMINNTMSPGWSPIQLSPMSNVSHFEMAHTFMPQVPTCDPRNQQNASSNMGQAWPPAYQTPNNFFVSVVRADDMTVEQTASWIRTLGQCNAWEEADEYAQKFAVNNIWGYLLQKLTNDALKHELGISKYGHRLEIMLAIKCLFPMMAGSNHLEGKDNENREEFGSPMVESVAEAKFVEGDASPVQAHRSPSLSSAMAMSPCNKALEPEEHKKEVMKWVGPPGVKSAKKFTMPKDPHFNARTTSTRARPSHPLTYKTLRKVKLRAGKSGHAKGIGYLPKGSVVVINQIKGRSGRIVFQQEDGQFVKAGWVTLFTQDKQQMLKKFNPKTKTE